MTTKQIEIQLSYFNILTNSKVTTQEFKTAIKYAYDITLKKALRFLVDNPEYNKMALNRIKTEIKRRNRNPNRYLENIKKEQYMNQVNLIGNLTKDPELTETSNGVILCRFPIAVNRDYVGSNGERKTDFFNCVAWRGLGETVAKWTKKGNKIRVTGSIETRTYEDSQGVKRSGVEVVAKDVEFLTAKTVAEDDTANKKLQPINDDDSDIPF